MTKKLRSYWLRIAPDIIGRIYRGRTTVIDERNNETLDPYNVDDKIKIYERQVKEWFLNKVSRSIRGKYFLFPYISIGFFTQNFKNKNNMVMN